MFQRASFHVLEVMFADRTWKQVKVKPEDDGFTAVCLQFPIVIFKDSRRSYVYGRITG
jgi:hypothetical protein